MSSQCPLGTPSDLPFQTSPDPQEPLLSPVCPLIVPSHPIPAVTQDMELFSLLHRKGGSPMSPAGSWCHQRAQTRAGSSFVGTRTEAGVSPGVSPAVSPGLGSLLEELCPGPVEFLGHGAVGATRAPRQHQAHLGLAPALDGSLGRLLQVPGGHPPVWGQHSDSTATGDTHRPPITAPTPARGSHRPKSLNFRTGNCSWAFPHPTVPMRVPPRGSPRPAVPPRVPWPSPGLTPRARRP